MPRALPIRARRPGVAASASVPRVAGWLVGALALALLMAGPTGGQPGGAASAPAPSPTVTVVTLNVLHGGAFSGRTGRDEHLEERFGLVVPALRALDPDVVGIQEASTSRERGNVAARLASALAFNYVYGAALFHLTSSSRFNEHVAAFMNFTEGPAVLSRFPIARQEVIKLPACSGLLDPRVLVYAELTTPWGVLPVFSTHISGVACQSDAVARLVSERRGALPGILMGDFNATEESPTITRLTQESGFVDAFRAANPGVVGPTVWQPVTAAAPLAQRRVDYVFVVPGRNGTGHVLESRVVIDRPGRRPDGTPLWPSDHYGVLVRLALDRAMVTAPGSPGEATREEDGPPVRATPEERSE